MFGLRLGDHPKAVVTTTPRPTPIIRALMRDPKTLITRGSTFDNAANLAPSALAQLREKYEGTRLGRQELFAEILDDVPGALWTRDGIKAGPIPADLARVVVAVDPSGASGSEDGDSIGIVVAARGANGRFYVLEDATCDLGPAGWGRRVVERYGHHRADLIVAERNFGGAMVESVIKTADRQAKVKLVTASRGKSVRAEPIAALYEQGRVTHAAGLDALEDQMMQMTLTGFMGDGSPDRVDALVWALTELALNRQVEASTSTVAGLY
jgi:predicted phage terminase large subunit-like protein